MAVGKGWEKAMKLIRFGVDKIRFDQLTRRHLSPHLKVNEGL
jgi:hypothetical protein